MAVLHRLSDGLLRRLLPEVPASADVGVMYCVPQDWCCGVDYRLYRCSDLTGLPWEECIRDTWCWQ